MASRHRFLIDGRERSVVVEQVDGRTTVAVDGGEPFEVDATVSGLPGLVSMLLEGKPADAHVSRRGPGFEVTVGGRRFSVEPAAAGRRARSPLGGAEDRPGAVTAPLAGLVVEVRVRSGDSIEQGQPLLVIEAMKMQNELQAPRGGTVTRVLCAQGERVERGDLLLEYEPDGSGQAGG